MNLKRRIVLAVSAAVLLPFAAHAQTATIGVSLAHFDPFLTIMQKAMAKEADAQKAAIQFEDANGDVGRQVSQVENFIAKRVSAIIVNPADTSATRRISEAARKAGIPLVYVNRKPDEKMGNGVVFVGSDNLVAGRLQMEELARQMGGKGNVAILVGELSTDAAQDRTRGVKEVASKYPGIRIVAEQVTNWDRKQAIDQMSKWLGMGMKINAVAANGDEEAIGALLAMKQARVSPKSILVAGVNASPEAMAYMKTGELAATVYQDARGQGAGSVDAALKLVRKQKVQDVQMIPFQLVTQDNMARFGSNSYN